MRNVAESNIADFGGCPSITGIMVRSRGHLSIPAGLGSERMSGRRARTLGVAIATILGLAVVYGAVQFVGGGSASSANGPPMRPIPITPGTVEEKDFPIYRIGLGTVQAYNTVTVKVRVDGEVQKIAFREGQDVEPGDLLARIDPRPFEAVLHQVEADKLRDEALLANAKLDLWRFKTLFPKEFSTGQNVDTQTALVSQYEAAIQHDQAAIDNARVQLGYTTISSPIQGRTGIRLIDQGNIVRAADTSGLVVITQLHPISVIFTLPQQALPDVTAALKRGPLTVLAYDQDNLVRLGEGKLEVIDNEIDQATGSARFKAVFSNDDERLWPGQFVNAWLRIEVRHGPVVAASAVQSGPNGDYAYVIQPDSSVKPGPVHVIATRDGQTLVESGLAPGDSVVVDGHYKLRPGAHVVDASKSGPRGAEQRTAEHAGGKAP
jgi:multidrug efflux system membrane fusion protein